MGLRIETHLKLCSNSTRARSHEMVGGQTSKGCAMHQYDHAYTNQAHRRELNSISRQYLPYLAPITSGRWQEACKQRRLDQGIHDPKDDDPVTEQLLPRVTADQATR